MPTSFWKIRSYTVLLHRSELDPGHDQRVLTLMSAPAFYRAEIPFRDAGPLHVGTISLLDPPNPTGELARSSWPAHRFEETYDVLRSENPVFLAYSWAPPDDEPDASYGSVLQIGITSATRPWWESA